MNVLDIKNMVFANQQNTEITCDVLFEHFAPEWLPFSANPEDPEAHGREIYARCMAGDFGSIGAFAQPSIDEIAVQVRAKRDTLLLASDWTQLPDVPQATKDLWVAYRQALRDVTEQSGFPQNVTWPTSPQ